MRRLPLLPYALASAAIVLTSTVVLCASLTRESGRGIEAVPSTRSIGPASLSAARLAYWRETPDGGGALWVSDLDGARRWTVASAADIDTVSLTRWSTDGGAIGYVEDGSVLLIAQLDGRRSAFPIPAEARAEKRRIVGYHWSRSGGRIAASLRTTHGHGKDSDVFVLDVRDGAEWRRITTLGAAFAGPWIDDERVLFDTLGNMIGVAGASRVDDVRPLTAMSGASPRLGEDGRIYFAGGISGSIELAEGPYAYGWIWSTTLDGGDLRRETAAYQDGVRLQGRWPDGRFAVAMPGAVRLMGDSLQPLPYDAGPILRVHVLPGGKGILGFTETRVVRIDPEATSASAAATGRAPLTVLLDAVKHPDAWSPSRLIAPAGEPARSRAGPAATLAFVLGGSAWLEGPDGSLRHVVARPAWQAWLGHPAWSPNGERLAIPVSEGGWRWRDGAKIRLFDRDGRSLTAIGGIEPIGWSPDGRTLAYTRASDQSAPEIVLAALDGDTREAVAGSLAGWTAHGLVVRGAGEQYSNTGWRIRQPIDLINGSSRRTITTTERLARHPLVARGVRADLVHSISALAPSPDGELIAALLVRIDPQERRATAGVLAIIRMSDGEPVVAITNDIRVGVHSLTWSPRGPLVGHTIEGEYTTDPPHLQTAGRAVVRDARSWAVVAEADGRFAGWSPDGDWWYAARRDGLYAHRLDGSGGIRVSRYGVTISAVRP